MATPDDYDSELQRQRQPPGRRVFVNYDPARHRLDSGRPRVAAFTALELADLTTGALDEHPVVLACRALMKVGA